MPSQDELNGQVEFMDRFHKRLTAADIKLAAVEAEAIKNEAVDCSFVIDGCPDYVAATRTASEQFNGFFIMVDQGYEAYGSVAKDSAADYLHGDSAGRDAVNHALDLRMLPDGEPSSLVDDLPLALQLTDRDPPQPEGAEPVPTLNFFDQKYEVPGGDGGQ